jgi:hypothetical protein
MEQVMQQGVEGRAALTRSPFDRAIAATKADTINEGIDENMPYYQRGHSELADD